MAHSFLKKSRIDQHVLLEHLVEEADEATRQLFVDILQRYNMFDPMKMADNEGLSTLDTQSSCMPESPLMAAHRGLIQTTEFDS